jgi:hypothetical protein
MLSASVVVDMFDAYDDADIIETIMEDLVACTSTGGRGSNFKVIKNYLDALDAVERGHWPEADEPRSFKARGWLVRPYLSEGLRRRYADMARAEQLEGLI